MEQTLSLSQQGADAALAKSGLSLKDFLADAKTRGLSYETTARELYIKTEGAVDITGSTVRRWIDELERVAS